MDTDEEIRQLILKNASTDQIRAAARRRECERWPKTAGGWLPPGITTVEEVLSVTTAKEVEQRHEKPRPANPPPASRWRDKI